MSKKLDKFKKKQKQENPDIKTGDKVKVHYQVEVNGEKRTQITEGLVIARKHGNDASATITVRQTIDKHFIEKIFPLHSPNIEKIELIKRGKARKSKLYFLRNKSRKEIRKKLKIK
jgi:large subunit ribosomal protein L19